MTIRIPVSEPDLGGNELKYLSDCLTSGWISSIGGYITEFEQRFAGWCGVSHGIATMNCTVGLHLALHALGVGPGDEVLVPALTFVASANAVAYTGATPVFVDAEPATWNMNPAEAQRRITPATKAIMPVHLYGHPVDMQPLLAMAREHDLLVVEDAAESHGAAAYGQQVGSFGNAGVFSFFGNKILTTGEGGMIVTNDTELAERLRSLRDHAMSSERRYWHEELGFNYRMTNLQAAIGVAQLERAEYLLTRKRQIALRYRQLLEDVPGLEMPPEQPWARNVYWMFSVLVDEREYGLDRDGLMDGLRQRGIDSRPFFHPMHHLPMYAGNESYPVAEELSVRGLNLPSSVKLSDDDILDICQTVRTLRRPAQQSSA